MGHRILSKTASHKTMKTERQLVGLLVGLLSMQEVISSSNPFPTLTITHRSNRVTELVEATIRALSEPTRRKSRPCPHSVKFDCKEQWELETALLTSSNRELWATMDASCQSGTRIR